MGNGLVLKFKGNKSFVPFSNLRDTEGLAKTWKVCTKITTYLEQGQRLENLSWRLWHLQSLMVEPDNKWEFGRLSKHMGEKLDKVKGR
jgi:GATA-binding protein, other eukaryote